jgi:diadenylate cyclase
MMILDLFQEVWRPAVEILIIAVAIYFPLKFVRGTRGWPIVLGFLALIVVVYVGARLSNFKVISWIMDRFLLTGFALAALVIFQPELRRILAQLGNLPFLHSAHEERENIEVIVRTAERLGEMRIGALLALERSIQLEEAVESGVAVDCQATPEMLETIFFPNNAIHDGGVIIRGDRIAKAACIFPLTQRQDLSKSLGTRHRAGIGLSEETDAVVVIVSEETGAISYAYGGNLIRSVSLEELRAFLTSVFVPGGEPAASLPAAGAKEPDRARAPDNVPAGTGADAVSKPATRQP